MVDTGASTVAISRELARSLKINIGINRIPAWTASKNERVNLVNLSSVTIGGIELHNIPAIITDHNYPLIPLLGMSFLKHTEITQRGSRLYIIYRGN